jgi:Ca2+/Na+ antiporter
LELLHKIRHSTFLKKYYFYIYRITIFILIQNNMKASFLSLLIVLTLVAPAVQAQGTATNENKSATALSGQFNDLKTKSNSYNEGNREYKVVNVAQLNAFWQSVQATIRDTEQKQIKDLNATRGDLETAQARIAEQEKELEALKVDNAQKEAAVQQSEDAVNNLSVLGIPIHKQVYVIINTAIIALLLIALGVVYTQFKSNKRVTDVKKKEFDDIDREFTDFKKNAREREIKIKRELQTEMNLVAELNEQIATLQKKVHA